MGKLKDVNKKIEETVVGGYKKVEDTVAGAASAAGHTKPQR